MVKAVSISERDLWMSYVERSFRHDFYHTWTYHSLEKNDTPLLLVYQEEEHFVALPLLLREVYDTGLYDMTCVYGYTGPLSNRNPEELDDSFVGRFGAALKGYLLSNNIVSVFSRLHPFYGNNRLFTELGGLYKNGKVVALDLSISLEKQRSKYAKIYSKIRRLRENGVYAKESKTFEDIRIFNEIYTENMSRVSASEAYLFSDEYLYELVNAEDSDTRLILIYNDQHQPICGTIAGFTGDVAQGHLIGTKKEFLPLSPTKLMVDVVTLAAREKGMKYFNLGGGLGYREDSLFQWKKSFSDVTFDYFSWRYIVDQTAYDKLLKDKNVPADVNVDLFPLYRAQLPSTASA